jgi:flagellar basal body-associated protein FliL
VRGDDYSLRATLTVQTSTEQESWLNGNQAQLSAALQNALTKADPARIRKPDGVTYLQDMLRDTTNSSLHTKNVQEILLTDFVIQSN